MTQDGPYLREIVNRDGILSAIRDLEKSKKGLEALVPEWHKDINAKVTSLYRSIRHTRYPDQESEKKHQMRGLELADMLIRDVLHVQEKGKYIDPFYKQFISDSSEGFETRLEYVGAMVKLLGELGALDKGPGERDLKAIWDRTNASVLCARTMLKGLNPDDNNRHLRNSYKVMTEFREALKRAYTVAGGQQYTLRSVPGEFKKEMHRRAG